MLHKLDLEDLDLLSTIVVLTSLAKLIHFKLTNHSPRHIYIQPVEKIFMMIILLKDTHM